MGRAVRLRSAGRSPPPAPPLLSRQARPSFGSSPLPGSQPPLCPAAASPASGSMFSWVSKDARRKKEPELFQTVAEGLRQLYAQKLLPLEEHYRFHEFHSPALEDADFDNKPMVLLVGQYSTGKTTFIRHLIEQDFPGMRIGPEPTTDSFIAVMHGPTEGVVPGNALVVDPRRPFRKLNAFGNAFLNRYPPFDPGGRGSGRGPDRPVTAAPAVLCLRGPRETLSDHSLRLGPLPLPIENPYEGVCECASPAPLALSPPPPHPRIFQVIGLTPNPPDRSQTHYYSLPLDAPNSFKPTPSPLPSRVCFLSVTENYGETFSHSLCWCAVLCLPRDRWERICCGLLSLGRPAEAADRARTSTSPRGSSEGPVLL